MADVGLIGNLVNEVFVKIYSTQKDADWTKSSDKILGFHYQCGINASNEWRTKKFNLRLPDENLDQEYEKKQFEEMGWKLKSRMQWQIYLIFYSTRLPFLQGMNIL